MITPSIKPTAPVKVTTTTVRLYKARYDCKGAKASSNGHEYPDSTESRHKLSSHYSGKISYVKLRSNAAFDVTADAGYFQLLHGKVGQNIP